MPRALRQEVRFSCLGPKRDILLERVYAYACRGRGVKREPKWEEGLFRFTAEGLKEEFAAVSVLDCATPKFSGQGTRVKVALPKKNMTRQYCVCLNCFKIVVFNF